MTQTDTKQLEGRALNEALALALGYEWTHYTRPDGETVTFLARRGGANKHWREWKPGKKGRVDLRNLPDWQGDPDAAMALATELQRRGYIVKIHLRGGEGCYCEIVDYPDMWTAVRATLPEAVALAALQALGEGGDG